MTQEATSTVPQRARVLIVDDDEVDRLAIVRGLSRAGFVLDIVEADSVASARAALAEPRDCMFLDYLLPDGDGLGLVQDLRRAGSRMPIVVLTGHGDEEIAVSVMKAGATDYLPKGQARPDRLSHLLRGAMKLAEAEEKAALAQAELEMARRQVAMSEKLSALGTLVSGVAHEIRTPLTYIANNLFLMQTRLAKLAEEDPTLRAKLQEVFQFGDQASEGVDRASALLKGLRSFANPAPSERVRADLAEVVASAVDLFRATQRGHVELEIDLATTPEVFVDRRQIQQAVLNLLLNAAEAMPRGGRVRVTTGPRGDSAAIDVADCGPGVAPEVQSRMFDPFFTTKAEGTGLGLAITRRIVEAHGGAISFTTTLGAGTCFTVLLPPAERAPDPPPARAAEGHEPLAVFRHAPR